MLSHFIQFSLHKGGEVFVKPTEIVSISLAPEGGARIVTRQNQIYYVSESVEDVHSTILLFFREIKNEGN